MTNVFHPGGRWLAFSAALFLASTVLAAAETGSRWGEGGGDDSASSGDAGKGRTILKANQKYLNRYCEGSPMSCICPSGSFKTTFWETEGATRPSQKKIMCVDKACKPDAVLRRRVDVASGVTSFNCVPIGKPPVALPQGSLNAGPH